MGCVVYFCFWFKNDLVMVVDVCFVVGLMVDDVCKLVFLIMFVYVFSLFLSSLGCDLVVFLLIKL